MPLDRVIEPAVPPLNVLALQDHVRQDIATDNVQLDIWCRAARAFAESKCNRTLIATRYRLTLDAFPARGGGNSFNYSTPFGLPPSAILLERGPVLAVQSIRYLDMSGIWQTMPSTDYVADLSGQFARITPVFGKVWPANTMPQIGSVQVLYDAGDAAGISVNVGTDTISIMGGLWRALNVGDTLRFTNSGGALPVPLAADTDYFVKTLPTATSFQLAATSGGAVLDLTTAGTGQSYLGYVPEGVGAWMKLRIGGLYENREDAMVVNRGTLFEVPYMDSLLDEFTVRLY